MKLIEKIKKFLAKKENGNLGFLQTSVLALVVVGLIITFALKIMGGVQDGMTAGSAAYNSTGSMISAIKTIADNAGTLVWVILGGVMIALLLYFFVPKRS